MNRHDNINIFGVNSQKKYGRAIPTFITPSYAPEMHYCSDSMAAPTGHMATRSRPINVNTASFSRHASAGLFFFNCVQKAYDSDLAVCTICSKKKSNIISISVLQIRRDKRDNLGIIFHNIPLKRMLRLVETVLKRGHNICFSLRNKKKISELSSIPPLIWRSGICTLRAILR